MTLVGGDELTAGAFTTAGAAAGTYKYPDVSGTPKALMTTAFVIENGAGDDVTSSYDITSDVTQTINPKRDIKTVDNSKS